MRLYEGWQFGIRMRIRVKVMKNEVANIGVPPWRYIIIKMFDYNCKFKYDVLFAS